MDQQALQAKGLQERWHANDAGCSKPTGRVAWANPLHIKVMVLGFWSFLHRVWMSCEGYLFAIYRK